MSEEPSPGEAIVQSVERARGGPAVLRELCSGLDPADTTRKPGVGKLSIIEHACHLLEMETDVFGARIRTVLEGETASLAASRGPRAAATGRRG